MMSLNTGFLTPEERFLWTCANQWRDPAGIDLPAGLNWARTVEIAQANRLPVLLDAVLRARGWLGRLPAEAQADLAYGVQKYNYLADHLGHDLRRFLGFAALQKLPVVVLKGLWLCEHIYGREDMRPGADIDVLLGEQDIPAALDILENKMGYGGWWRPLLDDAFYRRHHLHQQRCNADRSIWFEPHWLLDHPYTLLTIDYAGMMARTRPGKCLGLPVRELSRPDLLLTLIVHLVKHAVYLPFVYHRPDIARLILADGMLMYFMDVAEMIKQTAEEIDWTATIVLAQDSGVQDQFRAVLWVCRHYLDTPVPDDLFAALPGAQPGAVTRRLMNEMARAILSVYAGQPPTGLWAFLTGYHESIVFRPVRLLDLFRYAWPPADYLRRRYGRSDGLMRTRHLLRAAGQYARIGVDTAYYTAKRRWEVRNLDRRGYDWPPNPVFPFDRPDPAVVATEVEELA